MADSMFSALTAITTLSGTEEFPLANSGTSSKITAANMRKFMPGYEIDYVEITSIVTITATSDGNGNGTAVIDGNAKTYDGSTRICIEVFAPTVQADGNQSALLNLYDGTNDLGEIFQASNGASNAYAAPCAARRFLTPSAASHTFHIRGWKTGGTALVYAGAGGASTYMPAFYRITIA